MTTPCPDCGQLGAPDATACPNCGHALANNTLPPKSPTVKAPPPEVANWVIYKTPPKIVEEFRRTFNEEEFLAELRQAEQAGLPEFKDLIRDLEQEMNSSD